MLLNPMKVNYYNFSILFSAWNKHNQLKYMIWWVQSYLHSVDCFLSTKDVEKCMPQNTLIWGICRIFEAPTFKVLWCRIPYTTQPRMPRSCFPSTLSSLGLKKTMELNCQRHDPLREGYKWLSLSPLNSLDPCCKHATLSNDGCELIL